jgi:chromosome segregation ATPase
MSTIADLAGPAAASTGAEPSKLSQLEQLLKQGRVHLQDLRTKVEQATKERDEMAARLEARDADHEKLWAEQAEMQRADSDRHEREILELRAELSEASAARDVASAKRDELEAQVRESEEKRASLEKSLAAATTEADQLKADADRAADLAREIFETFSK